MTDQIQKLILLATILLAMVPALAFAESPLPTTCDSDINSLCPGLPYGQEVARCLNQHHDELTPNCREFVDNLKNRVSSESKGRPNYSPLGGMGFLPPLLPAITYTGWIAPQANPTAARQNSLNLQIPLAHDDLDSWGATIGGSNLHFDQPPILSGSNVPLANDFNRIEVTGQYSHNLKDEKMVGGRLSVGSASDHVFSSFAATQGVTTVSATADYGFAVSERSRWILFVMFSNNSTILNYVPIPGVIYIYNTKTFTGLFGFPFSSIRWMMSPVWTLSASIFGKNVTSEIAYGHLFEPQIFASISDGTQGFLRRSRANERDHLYYAEARALAGVRAPLVKSVIGELAGGYSFDRSIYERQQLFGSSQKSGLATLGASWVAQANLRASF